MNKSRAQWRSMTTKLAVKIDDLEKIPQISNEIASMLKSNPKVFLEKEAPYCFLSRVESSFAELTIGCNLRHMVSFPCPPFAFCKTDFLVFLDKGCVCFFSKKSSGSWIS